MDNYYESDRNIFSDFIHLDINAKTFTDMDEEYTLTSHHLASNSKTFENNFDLENQVFNVNTYSTQFESGEMGNMDVEEMENLIKHQATVDDGMRYFKEERVNFPDAPELNINFTPSTHLTVQKPNLDERTETVLTENTLVVPIPPRSNIFDQCEFDLQAEKKQMVELKAKEQTHRKKAADSIRKKIKIRIEEAIRSTVNKKFLKKFGKAAKIEFKKMPQYYLKDVTIYTNKKCLEMTIGDRYKEDFGNKNDKKFRHNSDLVDLVLARYSYDYEESILNMTLKDAILHYLGSQKYFRDLEKIEEEEGKEYREIYDAYARGGGDILGYIAYFEKTPANKQRKDKTKK